MTHCEQACSVIVSGGKLVPRPLIANRPAAQDVAMKMTLISPEAARRRSLCDRLEAAFMSEIALLKVGPEECDTNHSRQVLTGVQL